MEVVRFRQTASRINAQNLRVSIAMFTCGLPYNGENAAEAMVLNDDGCRRVFISARRWRAGEIALYVFELNRTRHNHVGRIDFRFFFFKYQSAVITETDLHINVNNRRSLSRFVLIYQKIKRTLYRYHRRATSTTIKLAPTPVEREY